jgi:hypothetical protein
MGIKNENHKAKRSRVYISLSDTELDKLKKLSYKEGMKPATFAKKSLKQSIDSIENIPESVNNDLQKVYSLLLNIWNNINQLARHSNIIKKVENENDVFWELRKIYKVVENYTKIRLENNEKDDY